MPTSRRPAILLSRLAALAFLVVTLVGGPVAAAAPATAIAPTLPYAAAQVEDPQLRAIEEAYNLLLDRYVHPLDSAAILVAGWNQMTRDSVERTAVPPPPVPGLGGDRGADINTVGQALLGYFGSEQPDGFKPSHSFIRGMVRFVDEGHTYFLDPQQYRDYQSWSRGENKYVGIGISMSSRGPEPRIVEVYDDTPAARAGLRGGDAVLRINGQSVQGLPVEGMSGLVRGPAGTSVTLEVSRLGELQPLTFVVQRAEISLQFVRQRLIDEDVGYVKLRGFPEPSVVESIEREVSSFQELGIRGLVLDLRGNSGGRIDVGTRLISHFLPANTSVYEEVNRSGQNRTHRSRTALRYDLPLVILVDGGTASMGEIFASALQAHGAATVLGTTTAGSVAAAQVFPLGDGSGLQVTVFEIKSVQGQPLNRVGVTPDEIIETDPMAVAQGQDPVLARAVELLRGAVAAQPAP